MDVLIQQLSRFGSTVATVLLHLWIRTQTVPALISGMCGENTRAIEKLVVIHQVLLDFAVRDDSADYWIEHHLVHIIARIEARRIGFDVLAGLLSGFLMPSQDVIDKYQHVHSSLQAVTSPGRIKAVSSFYSEPERQAWVAYYVGYAALQRSKMSISINWLQRSLNLACSDELKFRAGNLLGNLYFRSSLYHPLKAVECYRVSADAAARAPLGDDLIASGLYKLGLALCESDEFGEAHIVEKQLAEFAQATNDRIAKAYAAKFGGFYALMVGNNGESVHHNSRVVSFLEGLPLDMKVTQQEFLRGTLNGPSAIRVSATASLLLDAWTQLSEAQTDPVAAARAQMQLRKLRRIHGDEDILSRLRFLRSASKFHLDRGELKKAEEYAAELLSVATGLHWTYSVVWALVILAEICTKYSNAHSESNNQCFQIVSSLLDEAEKLAKPHPRLTSRVLLEQGLNHCRSGNYEGAIQKFEEDARRRVEVDEKFGSFNLQRVLYMETVKMSIQLLYSFLIQHPNSSRRQDALIWGEREKCRDLLYNLRKLEQRESYLRDFREFDRNDDAAWEEIKEVARLAGEDTMILVLQFCTETSSLLSFLLQWDFSDSELLYGARCSKLKEATGILQPPDGNFFRHLVQMTVNNVKCGGDLELLRIWYGLCIEPWESALNQCKPKKLVIVPHQEMSVLPFAAFHEAEGGEFLIQKYAISITPSLRMYKQCKLQQQKLASERRFNNALVIGNPCPGGDDDLPSAEWEANYVAERLRVVGLDVTELQGSQATKETAMSLIPETSWMHIASHAVINETYPYGALLLGSEAAAQTTSSTSRRDYAQLEETLRSIFRTTPDTRMLTGENLETTASSKALNVMAVVLSACSTGLGRIYSEGVLGLTRSFHMLGVPSVVASLWNVDDYSTKELMVKFYVHLEAGLDVASALQKAVVEMIEEQDEFGSSKYEPYQWAAFFVCGTDTALLTHP